MFLSPIKKNITFDIFPSSRFSLLHMNFFYGLDHIIYTSCIYIFTTYHHFIIARL